MSHKLKWVHPTAFFMLNSVMFLVFFYQERFLNGTWLKFEINLYLHYTTESMYST